MIQKGMGPALEKLWYIFMEWPKLPIKGILFCHVTQKKVMRLKSITVASSSYLTVPKNIFHLELNLYVVRQENVNVINFLYSLDLEYPLQNKKTKKILNLFS